LCQQLLDEGCIVFGLGRNNSNIQNSNYHFIKTDVRQIESVNSAFESIQTISKDEVHILINNAGLGYFGNVEDLPVEEWETMVQTNINGVFYCTRLAVPLMKKIGF